MFLISFHVLKAPAGGVTQGLPGMRTLRTHTQHLVVCMLTEKLPKPVLEMKYFKSDSA